MADRKYYCFCDSGCKFETLNKEQILTAITEAVNNGTVGNVDTGFITTVKTINGKPLKFFFGSQAEYEALTDSEKNNLFALITNDVNKDALFDAIAQLREEFTAFGVGVHDGSIVAKKAEAANKSEAAKQLQLPNIENTGYYYTDALQQVERFADEGLYYAQLEITVGGAVRPLGVFYYCRYPSHMAIFLGGDDTLPNLRVTIYGGGDFSVLDIDSGTDVTENYKIRAAKLGV